MSTDRSGPYGLQDELMFIRGLGRHTAKRTDHALAVLEYYNALRKRTDWGELDKDRVMKACHRELVG